MTSAAIIVVNHNSGGDLARCLGSLAVQDVTPDAIVVVDNRSTDGSLDRAIEAYPDVRFLARDVNDGFGAAANAGVLGSTGDPIVILNPDVELDPGWVEHATRCFVERSDLGVLGGKLLFGDRATVQHAGGIVRWPLCLADHRRYGLPDDPTETEYRDVDYVTGAAIAIRRTTFEQLGGFDERFFLYFEETDLCVRARAAGWAVEYDPALVGVHRESSAARRNSAFYYRNYHRGRIRFALRHHRVVDFITTFVPAERDRVTSVVPADELIGLRAAYLDGAAWLAEPATDGLAADAPEFRAALAADLRELASVALATVPPEHAAGPVPSRPIADDLVETVTVAPRVSPPGPPIVGRLLARARHFYWWATGQWYLSTIDQQNRHNARVLEAIHRLEVRLRDIEARHDSVADRQENRDDLLTSWLVEVDRELQDVRSTLDFGPDRGPDRP